MGSPPVQEGNIIVGAGQLWRCEEADVESVVSGIAGAADIELSVAPATTPLAGDRIRLYGIDESEDAGLYTVRAWTVGTLMLGVDEAISTNQATAGGTVVLLSRGGDSLGGTEDGSEIATNKEFFDVQAAEAPVTLRKSLVHVSGTSTFNLLESTLENLLLAIGHGAIATDEITVYTDGTVSEFGIRLETKAPSGSTTRTYLMPRLVSIGNAAHRYNKGASTAIACEVELLPIWNNVGDRWEFAIIEDS